MIKWEHNKAIETGIGNLQSVMELVIKISSNIEAKENKNSDDDYRQMISIAVAEIAKFTLGTYIAQIQLLQQSQKKIITSRGISNFSDGH